MGLLYDKFEWLLPLTYRRYTLIIAFFLAKINTPT